MLVIVTWRLLLPALHEPNFGFALDGHGGAAIQDFAGNLTFAKAFWARGAGYDVTSHLRLTSEWAGQPVRRAMPFISSPTMLWVLLPFALTPTAWSYVLWSLLGVVAVWRMTARSAALWIAVALLSPLSFVCFALGQTSLLTNAALLFLMDRHLGSQASHRAARNTKADWLDAIVLWSFTAKPPVALTADVLLLASRCWRPVVLAGGLTLLSTALVTPRLGFDWPGQYMDLMARTNVETGDPVFAWSLAPETMGNIRALLHVTWGVGDAVASRVSGYVWLATLAGLLIAGLRQDVRPEGLWSLTLLSYLLLCPHVSSTGELHLLIILALVGEAEPPIPKGARWAMVLAVLAALHLGHLPHGIGVHEEALRVPAAVTCKLLLAGLVWAQWGYSQRRVKNATLSARQSRELTL